MAVRSVTTHPVDESDVEISFETIRGFLARHRKLFAIFAIGGGLALGLVRLLSPREYTSSVSLLTQQRSPVAGASGLAAQFGLTLSSSEGGQSPQFYADLVQSPSILRDILLTRFGGRVLLDIYGSRGATEAKRLDDGKAALRKKLRSSVSPKTGVVTIYATAPSASLAAGIAKVVIDRINALNLRMRQEQAAADREFTEQRVTALAVELRRAEDRLQAFMQQNRDIRTPSLTFQQERLAREVSIRQQVFSSMSQAYEQARIESARNNPVVSVIDSPEVPSGPDPRGLFKGVLGGALAGSLLALVAGLWLDYRRTQMLR